MPTHSLACQLVVLSTVKEAAWRKGRVTVASYSSGAPAFPQRLRDLPYSLEHMATTHHQTKEYVPKAEPAVDPGNSGNQWAEVVSFRGWEDEIDLGPRQNHLTPALLPVVGTPEREEGRTMERTGRGSYQCPLQSRGNKSSAHCSTGHVFIPGDLRCPVCLTVRLLLFWPALGLGPSLQPRASALQRLQGSPQVYEGLGCCP